ncbi:hypothetical protein [Massilia sp. NR 4-1]|uniref:hypothetical protein n=1 Tax=Massilia sp. NR 4-1 TaxID=1678028 RepID=UPI00067A9EA7|nr:hypothetical protein [Massilia sp. NR 4-1]AKU21168.1 hypothetical protein ACZ75_06415 [Massilia sp. NR 4-1]
MGGRFRYALEPVRLNRAWELDALRLALGESQAVLAQRQATVDAARQRSEAAAAGWHSLAGAGQALTADRLLLAQRYIADCRRQLQDEQAALSARQAEHEELVAQVLAAQRALDAVEKHRKQALDEFKKARQSLEFKDADDQWGILQAGIGR